MTFAEVNTEIRSLFNTFWAGRTNVYYENENFDVTKEKNGGVKITEYIRLTIRQLSNEMIGIGSSASGRLKRSNCIVYIDYFFKPNTDIITINETIDDIIEAMQNKVLTNGFTYEGDRTPVTRTTNRSFNMVRISINLDYEQLTN